MIPIDRMGELSYSVQVGNPKAAQVVEVPLAQLGVRDTRAAGSVGNPKVAHPVEVPLAQLGVRDPLGQRDHGVVNLRLAHDDGPVVRQVQTR
eukprot:1195185-Prorocentrum_minimum.AAC.2